jgi:hypothetical protein
MISSARWTELMWVVRVLLVSATTVGAQPAQPPGTSQGVANPLQGFSQNRDQPVKIDADSLEVRDKDKLATFLGNVHVVQGDTTMICQTLVVFYEQSAAGRWRATTDSSPRSQGRRRRNPEGPDRDRPQRRLRYEDQYRDVDRECCGKPGSERRPGRPPRG